MTWTRVDHVEVGFADADSAGAGHDVSLPGGATATANSVDVIGIGSNTVVSSLVGQGFTAGPSRVVNQGGYSYWRKNTGGESATVNIKTSGNENTTVLWERWSSSSGFDKSASTGVDSSGAFANPSQSSGALAETAELVIAFATNTDPNAGVQGANPSWSAGFTLGGSAFSSVGGTTASWAGSFSGYNANAGTAAVTPVCTWDTSQYRNRYIFVLAFKQSAGGTDVSAPDVAGGYRLGADSGAQSVIDVVASDTPSGLRLGQGSVALASLAALDVAYGLRIGGSSVVTAKADVVGVDSPTGLRLGVSAAAATIAVVAADTPSGLRVGAQSTVVAGAVTILPDPAPGFLRLGGDTGVRVLSNVVAADTPGWFRLGASPATANVATPVDVSGADTPWGLRLGSSPVSAVVGGPASLDVDVYVRVRTKRVATTVARNRVSTTVRVKRA